MLTIPDLYKDALAVVNIFDSTVTVPPQLKDRILADINASLQLIAMAGEDFYCREELPVTLAIGTGAYTLDATVQTVLEPARLSGGKSLLGLRTRAQFDGFGPLFYGTLGTIANEEPVAYFVEALKTSSGAEAIQLILHVLPKPAAVDTLILNVIKTPSVFVSADLVDTSKIPPIPHKYHETILRPIVRYFLTTSSYFSNRDALGGLRDDYQRALISLGIADPRPGNPPTVNPELELKPQPQGGQ